MPGRCAGSHTHTHTHTHTQLSQELRGRRLNEPPHQDCCEECTRARPCSDWVYWKAKKNRRGAVWASCAVQESSACPLHSVKATSISKASLLASGRTLRAGPPGHQPDCPASPLCSRADAGDRDPRHPRRRAMSALRIDPTRAGDCMMNRAGRASAPPLTPPLSNRGQSASSARRRHTAPRRLNAAARSSHCLPPPIHHHSREAAVYSISTYYPVLSNPYPTRHCLVKFGVIWHASKRSSVRKQRPLWPSQAPFTCIRLEALHDCAAAPLGAPGRGSIAAAKRQQRQTQAMRAPAGGPGAREGTYRMPLGRGIRRDIEQAAHPARPGGR